MGDVVFFVEGCGERYDNDVGLLDEGDVGGDR